jgi:hypothetical protein
MKTVTIAESASDVHKLLDQARKEDILVRASDGTEFLVTAIDEFDHELARTRQNAKLMSLLDERAKQSHTIPLHDVKRQLGLAD